MSVRRELDRNGAQRLWVALLLCALVLFSLPLQAHRADCHLKLRSDCGACLAGSTIARVESRLASEHSPLRPVATLEAGFDVAPEHVAPLRLPGRAPPA